MRRDGGPVLAGCLAAIAACLAVDALVVWAVLQVIRFMTWLLAALASA